MESLAQDSGGDIGTRCQGDWLLGGPQDRKLEPIPSRPGVDLGMSNAWGTHSGTWCPPVHRILPPANPGLWSGGSCSSRHLSAVWLSPDPEAHPKGRGGAL